MVGALLIRDVKSKKMPHLEKNESAYLAAKLMVEEDTPAIIVLDKNTVCGTVSERNIISEVIVKGRDPKTTTVSEIMDRKVHYIEAEKTTVDAARMMRDLKVDMLVVTESKKAQGTITVRDIVDMYPALQMHIGQNTSKLSQP